LVILESIHEKGVDLLIRAYNSLKLENPTVPELVIAGPLDSVYAQKMIELVSTITQIHFPGMLSGNEKWGAFYGC
jgi:glycosyltransferase involved in cell wall biosynthesis